MVHGHVCQQSHHNRDYPAQFKAELETVKLDDPRLSNVWGKEIYRITLKAEEKKMTGNYKFVIQQVK